MSGFQSVSGRRLSGLEEIDTSFDFRTDAGGSDPDACSPTLRRYHQTLWSKPLPDGTPFELDVVTPGAYLHHQSAAGEFFLSSDSVIPTFSRWVRAQHVIEQVPAHEIEHFVSIGYTIGGMMIFPANVVAGRWTINQARGCTPRIADRMDLTLECIRRHYAGEPSPLRETLALYADFFALFGGFSGYVDHFLLDDLVQADRTIVQFFLPFDDFASPSVPQDLEAYREYRDRSIAFVLARNQRIRAWTESGADANLTRNSFRGRSIEGNAG